MKAWGVTPNDVERAARKVGVDAGDVRRVSANAVRFTLKPVRPETNGRAKYLRRSPRGRGVWAVCWHGHRDFMLALFEIAPKMRLQTAFADYHGQEHFLATYRDTYYKEAGPRISPVYYGNLCDCEEGR